MSVAGDKTVTARAFAWGLRIAIAFSVLGLTLGLLLHQLDDAYFAVQRHLIVVYFFRDQDTPWLLLAVLCLALMAWLARPGRGGVSRALESPRTLSTSSSMELLRGRRTSRPRTFPSWPWGSMSIARMRRPRLWAR